MATIADNITQAKQYAMDSLNNVETWIGKLNGLSNVSFEVAKIELPNDWVADPTGSLERLIALKPAKPTVGDITVSVPASPNITISDIEPESIPDFTGTKPVLSYGDKPSSELPPIPTDVTIADVTMPVKPTFVLPVAPTITGVNIPMPPSLSLPTFNESLPEDNLLAPTNQFVYSEGVYSSPLKDAINLKLLGDIENGGYGIEPSDEEALWERGRDRAYKEIQAAVEGVKSAFAILGHRMPPGSLAKAMNESRQKGHDAVHGLNRDITLKKADLFVQMRQFAITNGIQFESVLLTFYGSQMERALNASKYALDASLAIYNSSVETLKVKLIRYQASAQTYEQIIKAELTKSEIYRSQIEAIKVETDIKGQMIENYKAQLAGVELLMGIYKTEMEGANLFAKVEEMRLQAYKARVDAYSELVKSKAVEFQIYEAEINGEMKKLEVYKTEAEIYNRLLDASKTRMAQKELVYTAEVKQAALLLEKYNSEIRGYLARIDAKKFDIDAELTQYGHEINSYSSVANAVAKSLELTMESSRINAQIGIERARTSVSKAELELKSLEAATRVNYDASAKISDVYSDVATGAISVLTTMVTATSEL